MYMYAYIGVHARVDIGVRARADTHRAVGSKVRLVRFSIDIFPPHRFSNKNNYTKHLEYSTVHSDNKKLVLCSF